jgi:hypothetical protein
LLEAGSSWATTYAYKCVYGCSLRWLMQGGWVRDSGGIRPAFVYSSSCPGAYSTSVDICLFLLRASLALGDGVRCQTGGSCRGGRGRRGLRLWV